MSDDLVRELRRTPGWPTLGNAAADEIVRLEEELFESQETNFELRVQLSNYSDRLWELEIKYESLLEHALQNRIDDEGCDPIFVVLKNVIWDECYND